MSEQVSRPNILVLLSDQHRRDAMGCAGHAFVQTPHLDALARRGMMFPHAYTPNPLCVPARMALMTGQAAEHIRVWGNGNVLDTTIPTFAHGLGAAGYDTVLSGKMHFCGPDQFHGFERRMVGDPEDDLLDPALAVSELGHKWVADHLYAAKQTGPGRQGFQYYDQQVAAASVDYIRTRTTESRPWMMVAGFICPHNPFVCSQEWFDKYYPLVEAPSQEEREAMLATQPYLRFFANHTEVDKLTDEDYRRARAAYYGLCSELDENIGKILAALEEAGQLENTIVIYTSDHGEMAGDGGLWFKKALTESSVGVPFLAAGPGIPEGVRNETNISLLDLAPTLLDLAGGPPLPRTDGVSLVPALHGETAPLHADDVVWSENLGPEGCRHLFALWQGRWKYVYAPEVNEEHLFHLGDDPQERKDLANRSDMAERMAAMRLLRDKRWSYERTCKGLAEYNTRIKYLRGCGHPFLPHEAPRLTPSAEWVGFVKRN